MAKSHCFLRTDRNRLFIALVCVVHLLILSRCGYHFPGRGEFLTPEIQRIAIPIFTNQTTEVGIENYFTAALVEEFNRSKRIRLVREDRADATIKGTIKSYSSVPITFDAAGRVREYRCSMTVGVSLVEKESGEVLWGPSDLNDSEEYSADPNILVTESREGEAVKRIAEDLMEEVHEGIFEGF
ncbi:MAG: LptE family protein [Deltaproteobacteria bacterium]|nr:MAG: LptE family protein [Deltaproteobacteria bacterium]